MMKTVNKRTRKETFWVIRSGTPESGYFYKNCAGMTRYNYHDAEHYFYYGNAVAQRDKYHPGWDVVKVTVTEQVVG